MKRLAWLALFVAGAASAQSSISQGGYDVHYSAVPSISIPPQVARQYAITRSANRALLNIAVLRGGAPLKAAVTGAATNLAGQRQDLAVREVREGDAIYYLAEPRTADRETLDFDLSVTPDGAAAPIVVKFRQEFFPPMR